MGQHQVEDMVLALMERQEGRIDFTNDNSMVWPYTLELVCWRLMNV